MSTLPTPPSDQVSEDEPPGQRTVEVAIPNVGTFVIESEEGGYDDEVALPPIRSPLPLCADRESQAGLRWWLPVHVALRWLFQTDRNI